MGAATYVASRAGDVLRPMTHVPSGAGFFVPRVPGRPWEIVPTSRCRSSTTCPDARPELLAAGHPVAWFQGRMEFGPRALGARSILGCPSIPGIAARINAEIKYRERWRPFCPSLTDTVATDVLGTSHPAPFMTTAFDVTESWRSRIPEVVHIDGTARAQVVTRDTNPRYYALLERLGELTGAPVVLNTSLNPARRTHCLHTRPTPWMSSSAPTSAIWSWRIS